METNAFSSKVALNTMSETSTPNDIIRQFEEDYNKNNNTESIEMEEIQQNEENTQIYNLLDSENITEEEEEEPHMIRMEEEAVSSNNNREKKKARKRAKKKARKLKQKQNRMIKYTLQKQKIRQMLTGGTGTAQSGWWTCLLIVCYGLYNIGLTLSLVFVNNVMLPLQVEEMLVDKDSKTLSLAIVNSVSCVTNAIGSLIIGLMSDKLSIMTPFIIVGTTLWSVSIAGRYFFTLSQSTFSLAMYTIVNGAGFFFYGVAEAPFNALLPRKFKPQQFGLVSGVVGLTSLIGTILGASLFSYLWEKSHFWIPTAVAIITIVLTIAILPMAKKNKRLIQQLRVRFRSVEDPEIVSPPPLESPTEPMDQLQDVVVLHEDIPQDHRVANNFACAACCPRPIKLILRFLFEFYKPFRSRNYFLIVIVRFCMYVALAITQTYIIFFVEDMLDDDFSVFGNGDLISSPTEAYAIFSAVVAVFSLVASITSGILSDYVGKRKYYVCVSAIVAGVMQTLIVFVRNYSVMLVSASFTGLAIGTFFTTDLALANDLLPDKKDAGKDLAIYANAKTIPQLVAIPVSGVVIYYSNLLGASYSIPGLGYYVIFVISTIWAFMCGIAVLFIKEKRVRGNLAETKEFLDSIKTNFNDEAVVQIVDEEEEVNVVLA